MQKFTTQIKMTSGGAALSDDAPQLIESAETVARRLVDSNVKLVEMPTSEKRCKDALLASAAGKMQGGDDRFFSVFLDPVQLGETITAPHIRIAPMDQTAVKAWLSCQSMSKTATARPLNENMSWVCCQGRGQIR